jgi:DNA/RNA-binding domain of Phe-tRNA-synthetase-like protein
VPDVAMLQEFLDSGQVDAAVFAWNWRQARRTQLRDDTTTALFILDALSPMTDEALHAAADDLATHLARLGPGVQVARRLLCRAE